MNFSLLGTLTTPFFLYSERLFVPEFSEVEKHTESLVSIPKTAKRNICILLRVQPYCFEEVSNVKTEQWYFKVIPYQSFAAPTCDIGC
jgi:hypothetical protein